MKTNRRSPFIINCDTNQIRISAGEYIVSQSPSGLSMSHLGFSALFYGKIDLLVFASSGLKNQSLSFERIAGGFHIFPNGRRELACAVSRWELEAIDGLIVDCLLGRYTEEINIDTELSNIHGRVNFIFMISDFFL